jgi:hypothetical protein
MINNFGLNRFEKKIKSKLIILNLIIYFNLKPEETEVKLLIPSM